MSNHSFTLIDDDGCLVVSTIQAMKHWATNSFDYDFPSELIHHMREQRIVAWEAGREGNHKIEVHIDSSMPDGSIGPFRLRVFPEDHVVVMPYSQFTYAAACADGQVEEIDGLSYRFPMPSGFYDFYLRRHNGFAVYLMPSRTEEPFPLSDELPEP